MSFKGALIITDGDMMSMFNSIAKEIKTKDVNLEVTEGHRYDNETMHSIFDKFGDERMSRMLNSFVEYRKGDWNGCAIARAFGEFGALNKAVAESGKSLREYIIEYFQITPFEIDKIVYMYDQHPIRLEKQVRDWIELKRKEGPDVSVILSVTQTQKTESQTTQAQEDKVPAHAETASSSGN